MLNLEPPVRATTAKYLLDIAGRVNPVAWSTFISTPIYVHWPTVIENIKNYTDSNQTARRIIAAWEDGKLLSTPRENNFDELPSLVNLNDRFPDNVKVFCKTCDEYINLRKNFSREDIGGFTLNDL